MATQSHLIRVFETQHKLAIGCLCQEIIVQGRPKRSKMEVACGRRGKTSAAGRFRKMRARLFGLMALVLACSQLVTPVQR